MGVTLYIKAIPLDSTIILNEKHYPYPESAGRQMTEMPGRTDAFHEFHPILVHEENETIMRLPSQFHPLEKDKDDTIWCSIASKGSCYELARAIPVDWEDEDYPGTSAEWTDPAKIKSALEWLDKVELSTYLNVTKVYYG